MGACVVRRAWCMVRGAWCGNDRGGWKKYTQGSRGGEWIGGGGRGDAVGGGQQSGKNGSGALGLIFQAWELNASHARCTHLLNDTGTRAGSTRHSGPCRQPR